MPKHSRSFFRTSLMLCLLSALTACGARSMDASMSAGGAAPNMEGGAMMDHVGIL